ncbi:MAG: (deoxy)nucleoside triphosphate pyrophosphohydrolase [Clostridium sp.]
MKTIKVVAAIIRDKDKIFITRRGYGEFVDMWEFPGGKVEDGESKEEALIREINEELELRVKVLDLVITVEYDYETFHLSMDCFMCEIIGGEIKLNAHNKVKWIGFDELEKQKWVPADIEVIKPLLKLR